MIKINGNHNDDDHLFLFFWLYLNLTIKDILDHKIEFKFLIFFTKLASFSEKRPKNYTWTRNSKIF